jgi:MFS family permease
MSANEPHRDGAGGIESTYAWVRLGASLALSTIGGVGVWSVVVALPAVQAEFGVARAGASFPYTLTLLGFAIGGVVMGRLADKYGAMTPVVLGAVMIALGYAAAGSATTIWQYALAQGVLIGTGSAATFAPLVADTSLWFDRRRGAAIGIIASGNYIAGAIWSPFVQHFIANHGWRHTSYGIGVICLVTMLPLTLFLRRRAPRHDRIGSSPRRPVVSLERLGISPRALQMLLMTAGLACCVAMSMPQVHMVAYCSDLGYGAARGAQMLSLMLTCGVVSRLSFGVISDRIGGVMTVLIGAALQLVSLLLFLPFDGLASLYLISALFGPVPGRHRSRLRGHRQRILPAGGCGDARRRGLHDDAHRHGAGRLDDGRDLRRDRLLSRRVRQRRAVEPGDAVDRRMALVAYATGVAATGGGIRCVARDEPNGETRVADTATRATQLADRRFPLELTDPEAHPHLAVHRGCARQVRLALRRLVETAVEPPESRMAMRGERPHAELGGQRERVEIATRRLGAVGADATRALGKQQLRIRLVAALLLVGGELQRVVREARRRFGFAGKQMDFTALDENQRQPAHSSHRRGAFHR